MKLDWNDFIIKFDHLQENEILEEWVWLVGENMSIALITSIGDLFLKNEKDDYYWLDIGGGEYEKVASSKEEFETKLNNDEIRDEWFLIELVRRIKTSGLKLKEGELFGYKKLPVIGGEYEPENFELTLIEIHFNMWGQIHKQLNDVPNGTKINIKIID